MSESVLSEVIDGVGQLTLNRPKAINALSQEMIDSLFNTLTDWFRNETVTAVELRGEGERGFCAGADVRALRQSLVDGEPWLHVLETEYALDMLVANAPVPVTSHLHGISMGGGLGLGGHADRRIVYADTKMAMPETNIGFFPDCGILRLFSRAGAVGTHLTLTGATFTGGDALRLGLADESADGDLPAPLLDGDVAWIEECYEGDDASAIVQRLEAHAHPDAQAAAAQLRVRSPFAIHVSLRALRRAASLQLSEVLGQDLRLAERMVPVDFPEGVRALLVDKDHAPAWRWARIEDVPKEAVDEVFAY